MANCDHTKIDWHYDVVIWYGSNVLWYNMYADYDVAYAVNSVRNLINYEVDR